jgi:amidohydrolase
MALHGIVARRVDPLQPAVVSLGEIRGGAASNVIPAEVFLQGTLRSFDPTVRELLLEEVERSLAVVRAFGGDYKLEIERGYPAGKNHPEVSVWLERTAADLLGEAAIDKTRAGMGAEDFAYMTELAPGAMFNLGAAVGDFTRAHHTPVFDIDERALPVGAAILAETARRFLAGEIGLKR